MSKHHTRSGQRREPPVRDKWRQASRRAALQKRRRAGGVCLICVVCVVCVVCLSVWSFMHEWGIVLPLISILAAVAVKGSTVGASVEGGEYLECLE
jgi:cobalamin biosynthesis protein CobD/CbiB